MDKYPFTNFMKFLKSIQARDLTNIGGALQRIFSFLHVQRLALDIDRFGKLHLQLLSSENNQGKRWILSIPVLRQWTKGSDDLKFVCNQFSPRLLRVF